MKVDTMQEIKERQAQKEWLESLSLEHRGLLADMVMRSLRGSWRCPRKRAYLLEQIAETENVALYDAADLQQRVTRYFELIGRGQPDGRYWRSQYLEQDVDYAEYSVETLQWLADHIPNDITWTQSKIVEES